MKNRLQNLLQDRKTLYLALGIVVVSVFTLSVAYAAMSTVLEIHGNSEVVASSWDIHLENVEVKSGSVSANAPVISGNSTLAFDVELNTPGEFYEFTVDVVNEGTVDAMIDSVIKTPELTTEQAKYIKYDVSYENGESISTKQTLKKGTSTPIKVRVEYRKDLVASDLPSSSTELSLKLTLVYVQSDGTGSTIPNNGSDASLVRVVSGDGTQVGDEVCIKDECFYVISSDDTTVTMLAKYNLYVGNEVTVLTYNEENDDYVPTFKALTNPTGKQDSTAVGYRYDIESETFIYPFIGTTALSNSDCFDCYGGSAVEKYAADYGVYLTSLGADLYDSPRPIFIDELYDLGCDKYYDEEDNYYFNCLSAPSWVYSTSHWVTDAFGYMKMVLSDGDIFYYHEITISDYLLGVRPVIIISRSLL